MATAFGPEGCLILHWLSSVAPATFVFNLETGYQFKETLELRDRIRDRYGITVSYESPETTVENTKENMEGHCIELTHQHAAVIEKSLSSNACFLTSMRG